jgi:outer membrane protein assembly factor BamB
MFGRFAGFAGAPSCRIALAVSLLGASAVRADDPNWPMLGHDAGRSGCTTATIAPPLERIWYRAFPAEGIAAGVQPVVQGDSLYLGTLRGVLRAIDVETGRDRWSFQAGGPILHAAATDGQRVFFGAADGVIYALAVDDGSPVWTVRTGAAVWNAPAVHQGAVFIGSRDGRLYAIDAAKGTTLWTGETGGPILSSPAVDEARRRVIVGSEDMHAYCFDLAGKLLWKSPKLPGMSLRGYHPVIAPDGTVLITSAPFASMDRIHDVLYAMVREVFGDFASWRHTKEENERLRRENFALMEQPATYLRQLDSLRRQLAAQPAFQTLFLLDPQTGQPRGVTPIVHSESMNGPTMPPLVLADGRVLVKYSALLRSRYTSYSPFLNVGLLDTKTGHIDPLLDETRTYGWHDSLLLVHDEQSQLMAAGNLLLNTHQDNVNAIDLASKRGHAEPLCRGVHEVKPGQAAALWAMHLSGRALPVGWEWFARGTAVYGGGSVLDVPVVVAGDRMFYLPTHEINAGCTLIALQARSGGKASQRVELPAGAIADDDWDKVLAEKWDWDLLGMSRLTPALAGLPRRLPGTRQAPLLEAAAKAVAAIGDDELDALLDAPPVLAAVKPEENDAEAASFAALRGRLHAAVDELIGRKWQPLRFPAGKHPGEAYLVFDDPWETLYTLALAWPLLDAARQAGVSAHVRAMLADGGALSRASYSPNEGDVRSLFDPAPDSVVKYAAELRRSSTARLYPLWLWAHVTGDGELARSRWPRLREQVRFAADGDEPDLGNSRLAGLIAACRLAKLSGDDAWLADARPKVREALRERLRYELAHTEGGLITAAPVLRTLFGRWHFLTPDVARLLRTHAGPIHARLMDVYVDHHRPTWWLAWNVELLWRNETPLSFPSMSLDIFTARSLLLGEPPQDLAGYLDLPWCRGDEHHVQKLALALLRLE